MRPRAGRLPTRIAGVDEAGRGPLAGPVVAAAVILDPRRPIRGLRDSKQLDAAERERLRRMIRARAIAWGVGWADRDEIDCLNILQATLLAMRRALLALPVAPTHVRIDGNRCPVASTTCRCAMHARDDRSAATRVDAAISAASILAKTYRDALMVRARRALSGLRASPQHKGYGTPGAPAPRSSGTALADASPQSFEPGAPLPPWRGGLSKSRAMHRLRPPAAAHRVLAHRQRRAGRRSSSTRSRAAGMPAVAVTDQSNLFAMVKFYRAALERGIKPIIGVDLLVREADERAARLAPDAAVPEPGRLSQPDAAGEPRLSRRSGSGVPLVDRGWLDARQHRAG